MSDHTSSPAEPEFLPDEPCPVCHAPDWNPFTHIIHGVEDE